MQHSKLLIVLFLCTSYTFLIAQDNDCATTNATACDNSIISFNPNGTGIDDFIPQENDIGCLNREYSSIWIIFSFNNLTPPGSQIEFTITPSPAADFDFAVFGPNYDCSALGSPIVCSYADGTAPTGAGNGATDTSEGAFGDGFVAPITVNPNETYVLLVDDFSDDGGAFDLSWGGSAAPYLQCCPLTVDAGPDILACEGGAPFTLNGSAFANNGPVTYSWSATNGGEAYLSDLNSPTPTVSIPPGITGIFTYTLTAIDAECLESSSMTLTVNPNPTTSITASDVAVCPGGDLMLTANGIFSSYLWSTGEVTSAIIITEGGTYSVVATDANGCSASSSIDIATFPSSNIEITGNPIICFDSSTTLDAGSGYTSYTWSTGETTQQITVQNAGIYFVTITDGNGCKSIGNIETTLQEEITPIVLGNLSFCQGSHTTLDAGGSYASYQWSTGETTREITVATPGLYTVAVSDGNCGGEATVAVSENPLPIAVIAGNLNFCEGNTMLLSANAGFDYNWSTGQSTQNINISSGGIYEVSITDTNGCTDSTSVEAIQNPNPIPIINGNITLCSGSSTTLDAGTGYVDYQWSNGATTQTAIVSNVGVIDVIVTDANGCQGSSLINITEMPSPTVAIAGPSEICANEMAILTADSGFVDYAWSNSENGQSISINGSGTYSVIAIDENGCSAEASFIVNTAPNLIPTISGDSTFCSGSSTTLDAGTGYVDYQWSNGATTQTVDIETAGIISLTVFDTLGCSGTTSIEVLESILPTPNILGNLAFCSGDSTTLDAGIGYASYQWSTGSTNQTINVNQAGEYTVSLTNIEGCTTQGVVTVVENALPTVEIQGSHEICDGSTTTLYTEEGFSTYIWSNGSHAESLEVNEEGTYAITITDENGCEAIDQFNLSINSNPVPQILGNLSFCHGSSTILEGEEGFTQYTWTGDINNQTLEVNTAGNYELVVIDSNGCTGITFVEINENAELTPIIEGELSFCEGETTILDAGSNFDSYTWSDGSNEQQLEVNQPGDYSLTVTDGDCYGEVAVSVVENPLPQPEITGDAEFCQGNTANLLIQDIYTDYSWSNGSLYSNTIVNEGGTFSVLVTDENGCQNSATFEVIELANPNPEISGELGFCPSDSTELTTTNNYASYNWSSSENSPSIVVNTEGVVSLEVVDTQGCKGYTEVIIEAFLTNEPQIQGELNFCPGDSTILTVINSFESYQWSNNASQEASLKIDEEGVYQVSVTDANGCEASSSVTASLFAVSPPQITGETQYCEGSFTTLSANDGFESYSWSHTVTTQEVEINTPGEYTLSVMDENGCSSESNIEIVEHPLPQVSIMGSDSYCTGGSTILNAGAGFTTYEWSNNSQDQLIEVNTSGIVSVEVTDINGCQNTATLEIKEATELNVQIEGDLAICQGESTILSPGAFAIYEWSNNTSAPSLTTDQAGIYTVTVSDENGCLGTSSVEVIVYDNPLPQIIGTLGICEGETATLSLNEDYEIYSWNTTSNAATIETAIAGNYIVEVVDSNGCHGVNSVEVEVFSLPEAEIIGQDEFCEGDSTELMVNGTFASYYWSNGSTQNSILVNEAGEYEVVVTNAEGCESTLSIPIEEIPLPEAFPGDPQYIDCINTNVILGGTNLPETNYLYSWEGPGINSNNQNEHQPLVDVGGMYTLVIEDVEFGCISLPAQVEIEDLRYKPLVQLGVSDVLDCNTTTVLVDSDGSTIGTNIQYQWQYAFGEIVSHNQQFIATEPGVIILTIADELTGCTATDSILIEQNNDLPIVMAGEDQAIDCNTPEAILGSSNLPSNPNIIYEWRTENNGNIVSDPSQTTISVDAVGTYILTAVDITNGCISEDVVEVSGDFEIPLAEAGMDQELDCHTTRIALDASGSSSGNGISYQWQNTLGEILSESFSFETETPGFYELIVSDNNNGCIAKDTIEISRKEGELSAYDVREKSPTCLGDEDASLQVINIQGGESPYVYSINDLPFSNEAQFNGLSSGVYSIIVQDANGCEVWTEVTIEDGNDLQVDLGADLHIKLGEVVSLNGNVNLELEELEEIRWQSLDDQPLCNNCIEFNASPVRTTEYSLTVSDVNGCVASDQLNIFVDTRANIFIPNAFSPDGDGNNDHFTIFGGEDVVQIKSLKVFDRWGELMFEKNNFQANDEHQGWNGMFRGKTKGTGVYIYTAELEFIDGSVELFKGDVLLMK